MDKSEMDEGITLIADFLSNLMISSTVLGIPFPEALREHGPRIGMPEWFIEEIIKQSSDESVVEFLTINNHVVRKMTAQRVD